MIRLAPTSAAPGDRGVTHTAAADHRDGVVASDGPGVDRRAQAGHHAAAQQPGHRGIGRRVDLGALQLVHERLVGERADAKGRGQLGAVGQRHRLTGVERVEAVPRPAPLAGPAFTTHRAPVEDHEIAGFDVCHALADRLDGACRLVPEQERVLVVDAALAIGQVGMADPARDDVDDDLAGPGVGDDDIHHLYRLALLP